MVIFYVDFTFTFQVDFDGLVKVVILESQFSPCVLGFISFYDAADALLAVIGEPY